MRAAEERVQLVSKHSYLMVDKLFISHLTPHRGLSEEVDESFARGGVRSDTDVFDRADEVGGNSHSGRLACCRCAYDADVEVRRQSISASVHPDLFT